MEARKRKLHMPPGAVQEGNVAWWTDNVMSYDWSGEIGVERFSPAWFDDIDARFLRGAELFASEHTPFDRLIPFDQLRGKQVLEIGCGMGFHSELLARAGAHLTSVDISPTSIEATTRRLELKGLTSRIIHTDAEVLPFEAGSFDFVWSWGVIHHSANTARIVREIARVLRRHGETRVMVYNRQGAASVAAFFTDHVLKGKFLFQDFDETLFEASDGFSARFYVRDQFEDLFRAFFDDVHCSVLGQQADVVPLPRRLRRLVLPFVSRSYSEKAQGRRGSFLFLVARGLR
jgi:2-polyprenyl-3-methyl-5-hydroxy-6-metoxy-1,4-benzoquinol methylase